MMRARLIALSAFAAVACLVFALRGDWAETLAPEGAFYRVSLQGIAQGAQKDEHGPPVKVCSFLRGDGHVQLCAPSEGKDAAFAMLCAAFPLVAAGLALALFCGLLTFFSPYARRATAAACAGAAFAAVLAGTVLAMISMRPALAALAERDVQLGATGYTAAWIAIGLLAFSAGLSTTSTMLGHH